MCPTPYLGRPLFTTIVKMMMILPVGELSSAKVCHDSSTLLGSMVENSKNWSA